MLKHKPSLIVITGLALFAMYFGAGNLIFPVMLGADSGQNLPAAMAGMLITAVALPVIGLMALATSNGGIQDVTERIGKLPGTVLTVIIFLVTGVLYAIPRVAAVSYEMAVKPILETYTPGWEQSPLAVPTYMLIFFGLAIALTLRPGKMTRTIGIWLTPTLLVMLIILVLGVVFTQNPSTLPAQGNYATAPFQTGLLQGYFTMDANASLLFGALVLNVLHRHGYTEKKQILSGVTLAGLVAGTALAVIYVGLAMVGKHADITGEANGPQILSAAAVSIFGGYGQIFFGLIVLLACLTTVVGLISVSVTYFGEILPQIAPANLLGFHIFISYLLANVSLALILKLVLPVNLLLYPILIVLFIVSLLDAVVSSVQFRWVYKLSVLLTGIISLLHASNMFGSELVAQWYNSTYAAYVPLGAGEFAWVVPAVVGFSVGLALDLTREKELTSIGA